MKKRAHIYYSGNVHGVGFRYTTESMARELFLTGWVKNLSDGRVEVVCEGDESSINRFLIRLETRMKSYLSNIDIKLDVYKGEFSDFGIRFY
jgi:acylphosphatase